MNDLEREIVSLIEKMFQLENKIDALNEDVQAVELNSGLKNDTLENHQALEEMKLPIYTERASAVEMLFNIDEDINNIYGENSPIDFSTEYTAFYEKSKEQGVFNLDIYSKYLVDDGSSFF